jgi:hypothetical protein
MRPPWLDGSREEAELEALQTDVMRFTAILGLCLAAIFSLVHSAALEQAAPVPPPVQAQPPVADEPAAREAVLAVAKIPPTVAAVEKPASPRPATPAPFAETGDPQPGFTLEFASVGALESLLRSKAVQLYAHREGKFWVVNSQGGVVPATAPQAYYVMHADTVPPALREAVTTGAAVGAVTWGVTLPAATASQITRLTSSRKSGNLVIMPDGSVGADN